MTRHLVTIEELSDRDLDAICRLGTSPFDDTTLSGQGVALIFERPSLRTRASSSSAVHDLGGYVTFFSDDEIGLDVRESAEDVARTIAEMYAIAALRVRRHEVFARMREATGERLSLVNLMDDASHPTQAIADVLTIAEEFANGDVRGLSGLAVTYVGDATNVARSLSVALVRLGAHVTIAAPRGYQLEANGPENPAGLSGPGTLRALSDVRQAVAGADVVYTDTWVSMGRESEAAQRRADLAGFALTEEIMALANPRAILLHCLPAHRGEEVSNEVLDGAQSRVWRQVYHRRSSMMGVLRWIKGEE